MTRIHNLRELQVWRAARRLDMWVEPLKRSIMLAGIVWGLLTKAGSLSRSSRRPKAKAERLWRSSRKPVTKAETL